MALGIFRIPLLGGISQNQVERGWCRAARYGSCQSNTGGGGGSYEVVPESSGALEGGGEGGIKGIGGIYSCCEEPWIEGGHGDGGELGSFGYGHG